MKNFLYIFVFFFFFFLQSCSDNKGSIASSGSTSNPATLPAVEFTLIASGLNSPLQITHAGDGTKRLFVVEKRGTVRTIKDRIVDPAFFLNLTSRTNSSGSEQGLLGIAFPPNFSGKRYFYVNYTSRTGVGDTKIERVALTPGSDVVIGDQTQNLLSIVQPFSNHNGGQMTFGPDGYLYIGMGDGGGTGDPQNNAQNTSSLLGKILRIDVEASPTYQIPTGNPFGNEVWAYGLRNPWRFSFDRANGDLFIADVGQNQFEELNVQSAGTAGGSNYGWKILEGNSCYNSSDCERIGKTAPVFEYNHTDDNCSVTGGFVYRGSQFPALQGTYIFGDFCSGRVWGLRETSDGWVNQLLADTDFSISTFGEDEDGNIYLADFATGNVYQLIVP